MRAHRWGTLLVSTVLLAGCADQIGREWTPIDRFGSQISFVGDNSMLMNREWRRGESGRHQERVRLVGGGTFFFEEVYGSEFRWNPPSWLTDTVAVPLQKLYGITVSSGEVRTAPIDRGTIYYAAKPGKDEKTGRDLVCFVGTAMVNKFASEGNQRFDATVCRFNTTPERLAQDIVAIAARIRFDGGEASRATAPASSGERKSAAQPSSPSSTPPAQAAPPPSASAFHGSDATKPPVTSAFSSAGAVQPPAPPKPVAPPAPAPEPSSPTGNFLVSATIDALLDTADKGHVSNALQYTLEKNPIGQSNVWKNWANGNSGSVTPLRDYRDAKGQTCREFRQVVTLSGKGDSEAVFAQACRGSDGIWRRVLSG